MDASEAIQGFVAGRTLDSFVGDDLVRSAVITKLMIIGEAVSNLSDALKDKYPHVPWVKIRGFRNVVVHAYHQTNWSIVWNAATINAPELAQQVEEILRLEYPHAEPEHF
jgi:uncharacterized protein with HEPN domain